jgi:hypothetical protein
MPTIDDAAILRRAKQLCAQDAFACTAEGERTARASPALDDVGQRLCLARAREQLLDERQHGEELKE